MTTKDDNLSKRISARGEGKELTEGVAKQGFADASGEYPKQEYFFGNSINKAAKGEIVNELFAGGGDFGVDTILQDQNPSQYPYNQVQETQSGHVIEIDDTPAGERILIRHRTGAGVELRSDGSVLFSAVNKKVEVTGGDHTVIVEGEGNLVYKGNLNVRVTGDYNLQVDGNINVTTAGNKNEIINRNHTKTVNKNQNYTIKGNRGSQVVKTNTDTILGGNNLLVKGNQKNFVEGNVEFTSGGSFVQTAGSEWAASSQTTNISGNFISVMGTLGTIGGMGVDVYGKTFGGPPLGTGLPAAGSTATFYGNLMGRALEAITATKANLAGNAVHAFYAKTAGTAPEGPKVPSVPAVYPELTPQFITPIPPTAPMPNAATTMMHLTIGNYAVRNVQIDTDIDDPNSLIAQILKTDDYDNLFEYDPSIHEIRSKLRDENNLNNGKFTSNLVAAGKLSSTYRNIVPKKIGRTSPGTPSLRFGTKFIGNNPNDNKSKRFKPQ